jgi:hypothetical protein
MAVSGPGKSGKYTLVAALQVKDGETIEKALRKLIENLPEEAKKGLKMDVANVDGISIHGGKPDHLDEGTKKLFGEGLVYFAIRKDAVLLAGGDKGLEAIKEAVAAKAQTGKAMQFEMALARLVPVMAEKDKAAPTAAKQAFKEKGSDRVRMTIESGDKLELKISVKTAVLTFGSLLDKAKKEQEQ